MLRVIRQLLIVLIATSAGKELNSAGLLSAEISRLPIVRVRSTTSSSYAVDAGVLDWVSGLTITTPNVAVYGTAGRALPSESLDVSDDILRQIDGQTFCLLRTWIERRTGPFFSTERQYRIGESIYVQVSAVAGQLSNLSTLGAVEVGKPIILGAAVGAGTLELMVRGAGPALEAFAVTNFQSDPNLTVFSGAEPIAFNDNWSDNLLMGNSVRLASNRVGAFSFAEGSRDAALLRQLNSGTYTFQVGGTSTQSQLALVELYAVAGTQSYSGKLLNTSVRTTLSSQSPTVVGFNVLGGPVTVLIRAIGQTLSSFGVADAHPDPRVVLFAEGKELGSNDNWANNSRDPVVIEQAALSVGAFPLPRMSTDAVIYAALLPGAYSVVAQGLDGAAGSILLEVYAVLSKAHGPDAEDLDRDGISNWAEIQMGFDPMRPDSNGDGVPDITVLRVGLPATLNVVSGARGSNNHGVVIWRP